MLHHCTQKQVNRRSRRSFARLATQQESDYVGTTVNMPSRHQPRPIQMWDNACSSGRAVICVLATAIACSEPPRHARVPERKQDEQAEPMSLNGEPDFLGWEGSVAWEDAGGTEEFLKAYAQGVKEADTELREGEVTVYAYGLPVMSENLDKGTGLPYRGIAGCVVTDEDIGLAAGHNDRVRQHISARGLPACSRKKWEKEFFHLADYFVDRSQTEQPITLSPDQAALLSPDGRHSVHPKWSEEGRLRFVEIGDRGKVRGWARVGPFTLTALSFGEAEVGKLFWGPSGSDTALVKLERGPSHRTEIVVLVDLRTGGYLRYEEIAANDTRATK